MNPRQTIVPGHRILVDLEEEIIWLTELESLSRAAREAALDRSGQTLTPILDRTLELIAQLQGRAGERAEMLQAAGRQQNDLLVHTLGFFDRDQHANIVALFSRYIDAQERFARTHESSREYFDVALAVVREVTGALTQTNDDTTYRPYGQNAPATDVVPLAISELT